jgi:hypothetical protein
LEVAIVEDIIGDRIEGCVGYSHVIRSGSVAVATEEESTIAYGLNHIIGGVGKSVRKLIVADSSTSEPLCERSRSGNELLKVLSSRERSTYVNSFFGPWIRGVGSIGINVSIGEGKVS